MEPTSIINLPSNLLDIVMTRFNELIRTGEMLYQPLDEEIFTSGAFQAQFRIIPSLSKKPMHVPSSPVKNGTSKALLGTAPASFNPFLPPDPRFLLFALSPSKGAQATHNLVLNLYPSLRPSLLVTSADFRSQFDDLDPSDLESTWNVMRAMGDRFMAIYNCGRESGMSQLHRHMQVFPEDGYEPPVVSENGSNHSGHGTSEAKSREGFIMFPDREGSEKKELKSNLFTYLTQPYLNYVSYLEGSSEPSARDVISTYKRLLDFARKRYPANSLVSSDHDTVRVMPSYNLVMTRRWMLLVPRRQKGRQGTNANAAGMAGMVWISSDAERGVWEGFGVTEHLRFMGVEQGAVGAV